MAVRGSERGDGGQGCRSCRHGSTAGQHGLLGLALRPRLGLRSGRNGGTAGPARPDMGGPATETPNGVTASGAVVFVSSGLAHNMVPIITTAGSSERD